MFGGKTIDIFAYIRLLRIFEIWRCHAMATVQTSKRQQITSKNKIQTVLTLDNLQKTDHAYFLKTFTFKT